MLQHNGKDIFLTGVNLGNVQFLPFEGNQYGMPAAELRSMLGRALADISATGANSVRFWLHIDGRRSPTWGVDQVGVPGAANESSMHCMLHGSACCLLTSAVKAAAVVCDIECIFCVICCVAYT
jgi:hypothetical protein